MIFAGLSETVQTVFAACLTLLAALGAATCAAGKEKTLSSAAGNRNAIPPAAVGAAQPGRVPVRKGCVKKRPDCLLPAACGTILLALSFALLIRLPTGTLKGSAMLCFALGTAVLFLPGRWTSSVSPAAAVWIAHVSGMQPGALRMGAAAGLIAAAAAEWMLRRLTSEECRSILRGLCGAALYCLGAAASVLA